MKKLSLILAASALLVPGLATAGSVTINSNNTISSTPTNWGPTSLTFNQFNSGLGTLNSVSLKLYGVLNGSIGIWNFPVQPTDGQPLPDSLDTIISTLQADLIGSFGGACSVNCSVSVSPSAGFSDDVAIFTGEFNPLDPQVSHLISNATLSQVGSNLTEAGVLSDVTGAGTFDIAVTASGSSTASGGGNMVSFFSTSAGAYGEITYSYTDAEVSGTPEPASMILFGSALIGLGIARRKIRK